jgi:hypothetical protein
MKAIENGWTSEALNALQAPGNFDGALQKYKYDLEFAGETEKLKKIKEWEKTVFAPFKKEILDKKITSAKDMYDCIDKIRAFDELVQKEPLVCNNSELMDPTFGACRNVILPKMNNNLIDAMERELKTGKKEVGIPSKDLKKADYSEGMKSLLDNLRKTDNPEAMQQLAEAYISYKYMDGKTISAHPDLLNSKSTGYKTMTDELSKQSKDYIKTLIQAIKPENGTELADMLEFGDHGPYFSDFNDRLNAKNKKMALEDFIDGRLDGKKPQKSVSEVIDIMKKADEGVVTFNTRFGDVMRGLGAIEEARKKMAEDLHAKKLKDDPIVIDKRKMKELEKKQNDVYSKLSSYLDDKTKKIKERGGDPNTEEGIALLGVNGAKRYKAMKEARKSLMHTMRSTRRMKDNIPNQRERRISNYSSKKPYVIDGNDFRKDAVNEMFRIEHDKIREVSIKEYENRIAENDKFNALGANDKAKREVIDAHNKSITQSAERSLYCEMTQKMCYDKRKELMDNAPKKYEHPKVLPGMSEREKELAEKARERSIRSEIKANRDFYRNSKNMLTEIKASVNEFVKVENGQPVFNKDSKQMEYFNKMVMKPGEPFVENFKEGVLKASEKGSILPSNITKLRDEAITKCIEASKDNAKERQRYQSLSSGLGSDAYKKYAAKESAEKAKQAENAKKNVQNKQLNK